MMFLNLEDFKSFNKLCSIHLSYRNKIFKDCISAFMMSHEPIVILGIFYNQVALQNIYIFSSIICIIGIAQVWRKMEIKVIPL